jgi:hypothetical protein
MVRTHTRDFVPNVPEGSGARHWAAPNEPSGASLEAPPPPQPPVSIE